MSAPDTNSESEHQTPMVELFGQHMWHSAGALRLNADGAKALIASLERFLEGSNQAVEVFASDGEGYDLHLIQGDLHDNLDANHYLDAPGLQPDSADNLLYLLSKETKA